MKLKKERVIRLLGILLFAFMTIIVLYMMLSTFEWKIANDIGINISSIKSVQPKYNDNLKVKGSVPYWDQENALKSYDLNFEKIDNISLFWYYLTSDGDIETYKYADVDTNIIINAQKRNTKVFAVITNLPEEGSWDSERVENIINDDEKRKKHINDINNIIVKNGFDGVSIDYEEVDTSARSSFTKFIKELSEKLHANKKLVGVALHPKNGDPEYEERDGYGSQNWTLLSKYADELYIMAYGEHWDEGEAGPIASYDWVESIAEHAAGLNVDMKKFYLGIPLYGYFWNTDNDETAEGLEYSDVVNLLKQQNIEENWDEEFRSPYLRFDDEGNSYEAWFENARSAKEKVEIAKEYGFGGIAFWRLGNEDPGVWNEID